MNKVKKVSCGILKRDYENFYFSISKINHLGIQEFEEGEEIFFDIYYSKQEEELTRSVLSGVSLLINTPVYEEVDSKFDWHKKWKETYTPIELGKDILIASPWDEMSTDKKVIKILPGMGFGTGRHESTRIAAELLVEVLEYKNFDNFLDIGTGSGILAFIAEKYGQKNIEAFDNDPDAIENAVENQKENNSTNIKYQVCSIEDVKGSFSLVCANIIAEVLIKYEKDISKLTEEKGMLILSGIYKKFYNEVKSTYLKDYDIIKRRELGDWVGVWLLKR